MPLSLLVKPVSGRCNMRCKYCFYAEETARRASGDAGVMTERTLQNLIARAFRCAQDSVYFAFQGGEPSLAGVDFFRCAVRLQQEHSAGRVPYFNSLQTNGLCLSDELIAFLAENRFLVGVSLDGTQQAHDRYRLDASGRPTWARVRETLERLHRAGVEVNILCVVTREVAREPEAVFESLRPYGCLQFIPCLDPPDGPPGEWTPDAQEFGRFLTQTYRLYRRALLRGSYVSVRAFDNFLNMRRGLEPDSCAQCGRCAPYYVVEADGSVYPCDFYALDEWRLGNINETGFDRLARSPVASRFRAASLPVPEACRRCGCYSLCRNGCRRERLPESGVHRYCAAYRALLPSLLREDACDPLPSRYPSGAGL